MKSKFSDADYQSIYDSACKKGNEAALICPPAPVTDNLGNVMPQGACGYGIAWFPDGRSSVVRWFRKNNIGFKCSLGGWEVWFNPTPTENTWWGVQSFDPKYAYARVFVEEYSKHGIECYESSRHS